MYFRIKQSLKKSLTVLLMSLLRLVLMKLVSELGFDYCILSLNQGFQLVEAPRILCEVGDEFLNGRVQVEEILGVLSSK